MGGGPQIFYNVTMYRTYGYHGKLKNFIGCPFPPAVSMVSISSPAVSDVSPLAEFQRSCPLYPRQHCIPRLS